MSKRHLIEKKTAIMQAGYLLSSFRQRVLQEPASLARLLVRGGFVEEARRLEVAESIRGDLCEMLDDLASLPEKIAEAEWPNRTIDLRPQVESDGDANPSEIRAERAKWRRRKMRKLHAKGASKS